MSDSGNADWNAYVDSMSTAIGLPIAADYRAGVIGNLERMAQVAKAVNSLPLTDTDEAAGVFLP